MLHKCLLRFWKVSPKVKKLDLDLLLNRNWYEIIMGMRLLGTRLLWVRDYYGYEIIMGTRLLWV